MNALLLVMAGGAIGSAARLLVGRAASTAFGGGYPWGTLIVNLAGGLAMGLLMGSLIRWSAAEPLRLFVGVGLLGGFTTFSAFSFETMLMIERGATLAALGYALVSVIGSVAALSGGLMLTRSTL
jgi:CrcB protein